MPADPSGRAGLGAVDRRLAVSWLTGGARFVWLLLVAIVAQWPYRAAYHVSDDRYLQFLVGLFQTDRIGWINYLFEPLEGHFAPGWKFIYYVQWRWYGLEPQRWHLSITVVHVGTAWLLYWLLARYLKSRPAALFGATIWAAATIGRWDNPMAWLATGQIPWSLLCLLAAMVCQTQVLETGRRRWVIGIVACFSTAVLTWGASLALSVVLPLQLWLLGNPSSPGDRRRRGLLTVWMLSFVMLAILTAAALLPHMASSTTERSLPAGPEVVSRLVAQWSVTFATLSVWNYTSDPMQGLAGKRIAAAIALLLVVLLPQANRRVLAVFLGLGLVHLMLIGIFRSDVGFEAMVGWGRYLYLATLAWSVVAAVALDAVLRLTRGRVAWAILLVFAALVPPHIAHQRAIARDTMDEFVVFYSEEHEYFGRQVKLVEWLNENARSQNTRLSVPDLPLNIRPTDGIYFPLSSFAALVAPDGLLSLDIVRGNDVLRADLGPAARALSRSDSPMAPRWVQRTDALVEMLNHLQWLSQIATESGTTYRIPDVVVHFPAVHFPMTQLIGMNFSEGLPGCRVVALDDTDPHKFDRELEPLADQTSEHARWWEGVFRDPGELAVGLR